MHYFAFHIWFDNKSRNVKKVLLRKTGGKSKVEIKKETKIKLGPHGCQVKIISIIFHIYVKPQYPQL